MTMTWLDAVDTIRSARNKAAGKPLQNNTRLYVRGEGDEREFGVKLHNTEVVTINADGTYTLRAGGYHTITTMDRIRGYSPAKLFSERGDWYVRLQSDSKDPKPTRIEREVPKPYTAFAPGPEPVKTSEGCVAEQTVTTEHRNEVVECFRIDLKEGEQYEVVNEGLSSSNYDRVKVLRSWNSHVYIGEASMSYYDDGWSNLPGTSSSHGSYFINDDGERVEYVQCSHCKAFDDEHERWRHAMHGDRWGRRFDQPKGYATFAEMMATYGSREAWQQAYIEDFRKRRAYLKAAKEWDERNRVPFYDGIIVDAHGYALRERKSGPTKAKLAKHERDLAKMKKRIDKYVDGFIKALKSGMPMPGNGDCWYCLMHRPDGRTLGDAMDTLHSDGSLTVEPSHYHLDEHMKDRYYVPSLAINALRERGYRDAGIYMWLDMDPDNNTMGKPGGRYDGVKRDITKYMRKRLLPAAPTK